MQNKVQFSCGNNNKCVLTLMKGDITTLNVDAIVNAANPQLLGGSGVCGAIFAVAGKGLQKECDSITYHFPENSIPVGTAVITSSHKHNLCRYIIHAVGPVYDMYTPEVAAGHLASAYGNSILLCDNFNIKKIAFPSISTGIYGYPIQEAAKIALAEIIVQIEYSEVVEEIIFVLFDDETFNAYSDAINALNEVYYIDPGV